MASGRKFPPGYGNTSDLELGVKSDNNLTVCVQTKSIRLLDLFYMLDKTPVSEVSELERYEIVDLPHHHRHKHTHTHKAK